ncbi:MAG: VCBS repeat-containing protein [Kiritimatiellia bacterium]|nr:VCBS repeat-containing protein [Kiritimatiellia bacterium]
MLKIGSGNNFSAALFFFGVVVLTVSAGTTNIVPFSDDFESYANNTPLIDGTNGWYASSNSAVVQTNIVYGGSKAAMIPDCSLSNRVVRISNSNVWITMRAQPCLDDASRAAEYYMSTNSTAIFYVNTGGYCVVYNGTNGWTELTTKADGSPASQIESNTWSRFDLCINHSSRIWALYANYELLSTNLGFANSNTASFSGFDVYGPEVELTSYLDNVSADYSFPTNYATLAVDVTNVYRSILTGQNAASNSFHVWNSFDNSALLFTNTITYTNCGTWTNWLSVTPTNDTSHGELKTVWLVFDTISLPASSQPYQATVRIDASDEQFGTNAVNSPQFIQVSVYVQGSPRLWVSPLSLTNSVTAGYRASGQEIFVANTSSPPRVSMAYVVSSNANWISFSSSSGSVIDETNTVALTYLTENLEPGWHTGVVTVTASGIATQSVPVVMRVNSIPVLSWNAGQQTWTNSITEGETLSGITFDVWNGSSAPTGTMRFVVSDNAGWMSLSPAGGTSSGERQPVSVTYNVSGLSAGTYTGVVTVSGGDDSSGVTATSSPLTIAARLTVRGRAVLVTDTDSLANSVPENCNATNTAAFNVWNGAGTPRGGLSYSITSDSDWLSVSPSSGIITNETNAITVVWTAGSRAPGTYTGSIIVDGIDQLSGSRAFNAPKTITVQMTVLSRSPLNYEKPSIYGTPYIGQRLSARNGLWQNMDRLTFAYQWQRVNNAAGVGLTDLSGETTSNHVVTVADRGKYMRIAVTATDANPTPLSTTAYSELVSTAKIRAMPGDFNSDGIADLWFFDSSTGMWRASFTANSFAEGQFGSAGMTDVPGDYNGDGILDLGLYDSAHGIWYILYLPSGPSISGSMFGGLTEETQATPVPADYNGDGQTDVALYWRGYWAILYSGLGRIVIIPPIAGANAVPAPADYDGDGSIDLAVYDSGLWTIRNVWGELWSVSFGGAEWLPAPGDYDGDSISDLCVFNQASNVWSMVYSSSGVTHSQSFGSSSGANLPRQGYYDHDRYCDPATLRYSVNSDFVIWCVTRTTDTNFTYRGQSYQKSINDWRVSW